MSPKPFQRESVTIIRGGTHKREWRNIPAGEVRAGDTVGEVGAIVAVEDEGDRVRWTRSGLSNPYRAPKNRVVLAFVLVES